MVIKAAALYNAGTISAHIKPSVRPPMEEHELLEVVFREDLKLEKYIDDEESAKMLFASARWLLKAKQNLQDAIRSNPYDKDILRNLELTIKRHNAVVGAINSLYQDMQASDDKTGQSKLESMIDVLNLGWPDEVEEKEGDEKASSTYKISERF